MYTLELTPFLKEEVYDSSRWYEPQPNVSGYESDGTDDSSSVYKDWFAQPPAGASYPVPAGASPASPDTCSTPGPHVRNEADRLVDLNDPFQQDAQNRSGLRSGRPIRLS